MSRLSAFVAILCASSFAIGESNTGLGPGGEEPILPAEREHWAFTRLVAPTVPQVKDSHRIVNPIDAFVLSRLESEGLQPMPVADRRTLIRRVTFDLTGLPPTYEDVERFRHDPDPEAYQKLVDRLLDSPAYGERWAQHWLDLARYAETDGFEHDNHRPTAWKYRDWVIDALNADIGYDEFLKRQIAGDELYPDEDDAHIATGFLLCGPDMPDINLQEERRDMALNEITATIGSAAMGLQFGCAQCHNHKFDPISQADFFRLRAFFANVDLFGKKPQGRVVRETGPNAPDSFLMVRGDFRRPGAKVEPAFPRIVNTEKRSVPAPPPDASTSRRRVALVEWLTQPDHPLTTRVIVNRLWQGHFGRGLVGTPSDFGILGEEPSHPELLDWLAAELPRQNWSLKRMHRLIVGSATYQTMSVPGESDVERKNWRSLTEADPENLLWGRRTPVRLQGEAIRDAILATSGRLNREAGGPGVMAPLPEEVLKTIRKDHWTVDEDHSQHRRRSVYMFVRRNLAYPMFSVFDKPDAIASCDCRNVSTIAPQALTLFNSDFAIENAAELARLARHDHSEAAATVRFCFRRALQRDPAPDELDVALALTEGGGVESMDPLTPLCLALFNLNEFVYVD